MVLAFMKLATKVREDLILQLQYINSEAMEICNRYLLQRK